MCTTTWRAHAASRTKEPAAHPLSESFSVAAGKSAGLLYIAVVAVLSYMVLADFL